MDGTVCGKDELDAYLAMSFTNNSDVLRFAKNPLLFWMSPRAMLTLPLLRMVAIHTLCKQGTALPCERLFSTAGDTCTRKRNRTMPDKISDLVVLNSDCRIKRMRS